MQDVHLRALRARFGWKACNCVHCRQRPTIDKKREHRVARRILKQRLKKGGITCP